MLVTNCNNVKTGTYSKLKTALLIGECNSGSRDVSIQMTFVESGGEQELHKHPQSQCYYVIEGKGIMIIESENQQVNKGDSIYIPGNSIHGIINNGKEALTYLTANQAFGILKENEIWKD